MKVSFNRVNERERFYSTWKFVAHENKTKTMNTEKTFDKKEDFALLFIFSYFFCYISTF